MTSMVESPVARRIGDVAVIGPLGRRPRGSVPSRATIRSRIQGGGGPHSPPHAHTWAAGQSSDSSQRSRPSTTSCQASRRQDAHGSQ
ncbi:hypothetical protein ACFXPW_00490 [Streptomyces goshikiensis]|uniref:hypothetical protein n=1 Tax=Streptomyces goshikiensis TaxID=1942 RepID=UPI0036CABE4F